MNVLPPLLPPLRGHDRAAVEHFVTACRASALVLTREGHPAQAHALQEAAAAAQSTAEGAATSVARARAQVTAGQLDRLAGREPTPSRQPLAGGR